MTIVWDLDYTLMDTVKFKAALKAEVMSLGPTSEEYDAAYELVVGRKEPGKVYDYDSELHIQGMAKYFSDEEAVEAVRKKIEGVLDRSAEFLYPGAVEMLQRMREEGVKLILLTLGNEKWQQEKVGRSGIEKLFDEVVITATDKGEIINRFSKEVPPIIFINDNPNEIAEMREALRGLAGAEFIWKKGPKEPKPEVVEKIKDLKPYDDLREIEAKALRKEGTREPGSEWQNVLPKRT